LYAVEISAARGTDFEFVVNSQNLVAYPVPVMLSPDEFSRPFAQARAKFMVLSKRHDLFRVFPNIFVRDAQSDFESVLPVPDFTPARHVADQDRATAAHRF